MLHAVFEALLMAAGMAWRVAWSLVLGFVISGLLQTLISRQAMTAALGRGGPRQVALAALAGAASSSCSYAAAAISRTLIAGGAALAPALAFLFASTNLVAELGLVLILLMGWQFAAAEWAGGILLIVIMTLLVRLACPAGLVEAARARARQASGHQHGGPVMEEGGFAARLLRKNTWVAVAQAFAMDWSMLWKDVVLGFLIAGVLAAWVPDSVWRALFLQGDTPWLRAGGDALLGPLVAVLSFVCSIGNVPMAAVLWGSGVSFGGVLAFLYADLIVLPLLDVYRRYFGWRMAAYIAALFYTTMVAAALIMDGVFHALHLVPRVRPDMQGSFAHFGLDATFGLNLIALAGALALFALARRHKAVAHCPHHGGCH
jgi:uncharacterized membrane protein YraQ (UPF0718 family)